MLLGRIASITSGLLLAAFLLQGPHCAEAQATAPALSGRVLDQNHEALPGAVVSVRKLSGDAYETTATADETGRYSFDAMPDGNYSVCATLPGFVSACFQPIRVYFPAKARWEFALRITYLGTEGGVYSSSDVVGELMAQGRRLANARICLSRIGENTPMACTTTNRFGQYFLSVGPGKYTINLLTDGNDVHGSLDLSIAGEYRNKIDLQQLRP